MADWAAGVGSQVQGEAAKYGLSFSNYFTFRDYLNASFGLRAKSIIYVEEHSTNRKEGSRAHTKPACRPCLGLIHVRGATQFYYFVRVFLVDSVH